MAFRVSREDRESGELVDEESSSAMSLLLMPYGIAVVAGDPTKISLQG